MRTLDVHNESGNVVRRRELSDCFAETKINETVLHQCVVTHLANQRSGTASTKTRSEVRGSGRKLFRQKGTGRARAGDAKSPTRVGGGVAFGPEPRSHRKDLPRKVRRLGVSSALSIKLRDGNCKLIEDFSLQKPKTKIVASILEALDLSGKTLLVLGEQDRNIYLSVRNIPKVNSCTWELLNTYQLLWHDNLVITESAIDQLESKYAN